MTSVSIIEGTTILKSSIIEKEDNTNTDILKFVTSSTTSISIGDLVSYYDRNSNLLFKGYVQTLTHGNGFKEVEVYDLGSELLYRTLNEIITTTSPEGIIEYVITNFTNLVYVSTISSGETIDIYRAKNKRAIDVVTEMSELLLANFRVDTSGNFQLELEGDTLSSKSINTNNAILTGGWVRDKTQLINSVIVEGDRQTFEKTESFAGPSTSVTLSEIPIDVYVTVGGTEKTGYVIGQSTGDYYVNRETKTINFSVSSSTIIVKYTYSIPINARRRIKESIDAYGQHDKTYQKSYIKTREEARSYCNYILNLYSEPLLSSKWVMTRNSDYNDFNSFIPNNIISVTDSINNISGNFIIKKVTREFPGKLTIEVGDPSDDIIFWQKEVQTRIKQLEDEDDNSDTINEDEQVIENLQVQVSNEITLLSRDLPDDSIYLFDQDIYGNADTSNVNNGEERPFSSNIDGLEVWFKLNNNAKDYSENKLNSTWTGTEAYNIGNAFDLSASFNGSSYTTSAIPTFDINDCSISLWINPSSVSSGRPFGISNTATSDNYFTLKFSSGTLLPDMRDDNSGALAGNGVSVSASEWTHIILTKSGNTITLYKNNGTGVTTDATGQDNFSFNVIALGALVRSTISEYYTGKIADVRLYDKVLSANERTRLYNSGLGIVDNAINKDGIVLQSIHYMFSDNNIHSINPNNEMSDLESYYDMNGDSVDSVGGNDGTDTDISYVTGKVGQAASFNGSTSNIQADTNIIGYPFTLMCWVYFDSVSGTESVLGLNDISETNIYYRIWRNGTKISMSASNTTDDTTDGVTTISDSTWYHVAVRFISSTSRILYLNGGKESYDTTSVTFNSNVDKLLIGAKEVSSGSEFLSGDVDDVLILSRDVTTDEIVARYNEGSGKTDKYGSWETVN